MYALNFIYERPFLATFWISNFQYKVIENAKKIKWLTTKKNWLSNIPKQNMWLFSETNIYIWI